MAKQILSEVKHERWRVTKYLEDASVGSSDELYEIAFLPEEKGEVEVGISELDVFEIADLHAALVGLMAMEDRKSAKGKVTGV